MFEDDSFKSNIDDKVLAESYKELVANSAIFSISKSASLVDSLEQYGTPIMLVETPEEVAGFDAIGAPAFCPNDGKLTYELCDFFADQTLCIASHNQNFIYDSARKLDSYGIPSPPLYIEDLDLTDYYGTYEKAFTAPEYIFQEHTPKPPMESAEATVFDLNNALKLEPREWIYGRHLQRKFIAMLVSPGGVGKTALSLVQAISIATGRDLLGEWVGEPKRVWVWNLEDPREEMEKRIAAICLHYGVTSEDLGGRLLLDIGRETELCITYEEPKDEKKDGDKSSKNEPKIARPVCEERLSNACVKHRIDVLIIDPFVASHDKIENDTVQMNKVAAAFSRTAEKANIAVLLVHHMRKTNGEGVTIDAARGAKSITDATRSAVLLEQMSEDEAENAGVKNRRLYFKESNAKPSMSPPSEAAKWYKLASYHLDNDNGQDYGAEYYGEKAGDNIGVVEPWKWPDAFKQMTHVQKDIILKKLSTAEFKLKGIGENSASVMIAEVLELEIKDKSVQSQCRTILNQWLKNGAIKTIEKRCCIGKRIAPFVTLKGAK